MKQNLNNIYNLLQKRNISNVPHKRDLNFNPIKTVWITLNRSCNFRCPHCYAQNTGFQKALEMPLEAVKELVDFSKDIGAQIIILIGGEPLFYKDLFAVLDYIKEKGLISAIASNGYRLGDDDFFRQIEKSPMGSLVFSLKAGSAELYQKLTQTDSFAAIRKAVKNFSKLTSPWNSYNVVLTKDTLTDLPNIAALIKEDKSKALRINFCEPAIDINSKINTDSLLPPDEIISYLTAHYEELDVLLEGRLLIQQSFPRCFWPKDFLRKLEQKKQIAFSCHLYNRTGLIFDTHRRLLLCNSLPDFPLAQFGTDFSSAEEFKRFFMQKDVCDLYNGIFNYTAKSCIKCADYPACYGGCPLKLFHYSGADVDHKQRGDAQ